MGKIKKGILGGFRGKVGTTVGTFWKGRAVMRSLPETSQSDPTNKQILVRARFKVLGNLMSRMYSAIALGFKDVARALQLTEGDVFVKDNWESVSASSADDVTVSYPDLIMAEGNLTNVAYGTPDWGAAEHLTIGVTFTDNTGAPFTSANDEVYVFAYVPDLGEGVISTASTRSTGSASIVCPNSWNGMTAHLYGFCVGQDSMAGRTSNSVYIGNGEIA